MAEAAIAVATEHGFPFELAYATFEHRWALLQQGLWAEGITEMRQGRDGLVATGSLVRPRWLAFLAEAIAKSDSAREGLKLLADAMALLDSTEERMHEAELHRLKGEALVMENAANATDAQRCFRVAIVISRSQSAKSLELRAPGTPARIAGPTR